MTSGPNNSIFVCVWRFWSCLILLNHIDDMRQGNSPKGLNDIVDILVKLVEIGIKCMIWFTTSHNVLLLHRRQQASV